MNTEQTSKNIFMYSISLPKLWKMGSTNLGCVIPKLAKAWLIDLIEIEKLLRNKANRNF